MQTFLPEPNFRDSAKCLDNKRLGKQRVECKQILDILIGASPNSRWRHHPAVLQWRGHEGALYSYLLAVCNEWVSRGYNNDMMGKYCDIVFSRYGGKWFTAERSTAPAWIGSPEFHDSHKSRLLQKDPNYYSKFGWRVPRDLEYVWPVKGKIVP